MTEVKIKTISDRVYYTTTDLASGDYINLVMKLVIEDFLPVKDVFNNEVWVKRDEIESFTFIKEVNDD
ncbi:hypothetical protein CD116_00445 [Staphylococcus schweitzeri]|uniref:Uncharacterized protein n=1 Tax=Staphylococcus schweitzeri TaxID=1654388 RepID=A0A2K4ANQ7_9STAP|nr:hypothetical protein [Staphylococcus schweitzeri]MBE2129752.1 hypothetical protein [Staphylococcus schweitzeri]PNZ51682.1 hypothetical protein CD116_00445 [Staphylococcus schweitzeri]CDR55000.1 phiSLT ORF 77-like protein [Staphylococcus schweitzeri]VEE65383.1 Uncharacterised protein [Staphylococcus schweitzeri]